MPLPEDGGALGEEAPPGAPPGRGARSWGASGLGLCALVVAAPFACALVGASGPRSLSLHLGPGDSPYITGFAPKFEIENGIGTHWTTPDARIELPLTVSGGPVALVYRCARVLPQTGHVEVSLAGHPVDRFASRGGRFEDHRVELGGLRETPLALGFEVRSKDPRNLGVKLEWVRFETGSGSRIRLRGAARFAPSFMLAAVLALLVVAGWGEGAAAALAAPPALAACIALLRDPWLVERLLVGIPWALLAGLVALAAARRWAPRKGEGAADVRHATALATLAFLLRALALNHPDYFYPDLMLHARLVEVVRDAGLDIVVSPSRYLWQPRERGEPAVAGGPRVLRAESGLWLKEVGGVPVGMPYSLAFHAPFALVPLGLDQRIRAMKVAGAALSVVPLVLLFGFARRVGASTWGAALMVLVPSYASKLSVAALPAVFGHAVDVSVLLWLSSRVRHLTGARAWVLGSVVVAASQLAYVSAVIHMSVLLLVLATLVALEGGPGRGRAAAGILVVAAGGSALALAAYYRDFLESVGIVLLSLLPSAAGAASAHVSEGFLHLVLDRTLSFFGPGFAVLALLGLGSMRACRGRILVGAWALTYVLLLFLRSRVPDVFRWVHDTLFVSPLIALSAGQCLAACASWRGWWGRGLAAALALLLAFQGLALQVQAFAHPGSLP